MNISITGNLGAGKTTIRDELKKMGYDAVSGGDIFRKVAQEKGVSVVELNAMVEEEVKNGKRDIDDEIDGMSAKLGRELDNTVFDFRLGWNFVPDSFKVFVIIDPDIAAARVYNGNARSAETYRNIEDTKESLHRRATIEAERFADLYGIDYYREDNYDLIIESSYAAPAQIAEEIVRCCKAYEAGEVRRKILYGIPERPGEWSAVDEREKRPDFMFHFCGAEEQD